MTPSKLLTCGALLVSGTLTASAGLISLGPATLSTDVSSLPTLLTIQNTGTVSGCIGFIGGIDVAGLAACPGGFTGSGGNELGALTMTGTRTIAEVNAAGITDVDRLLFIFHSGEPGSGPVTIQDLALTFFDVTNDITFTASLAGVPMALASTAGGSASNTGFVFGFDTFQAGLAADFFSNGQNRIGAAATLSGSSGGVNTFLLAAAPTPASAVPEPSTLSGIASGLLMAVAFRYRGAHRKRG